MKTIKSMRIIFFCFCLIIMTTHSAVAQDSIIKGRWNAKLGYSRIPTGSIGPRTQTLGHLRAEVNYGFFKFMEAGIYVGGSKRDTYVWDPIDSTSTRYPNKLRPSYGLNVNLHLLPFLIKDKTDFRFDLYITSKVGYSSLFYRDDQKLKSNHLLEYGAGVGLSFYLWDHVGFFAEHTWGKYSYRNTTALRYGLTFKF